MSDQGVTEPGAAAPPAERPLGRELGRRLAAPAAALGGVAAAFGYVGSVDPNVPGHYPVCPLLRLTGVYCPGCGGLRSAYAVVHGQYATAVGANALAVAGYLLFAGLWLVWAYRAVRGQRFALRVRPAQWWAVGALVLAFTVARNLPFGAALTP